MQTQNRLLDDLAKVAGGAMGTLAGLKTEIETLVRQRMEAILADMDMVPREDFEALKEMVAKARAEQDALHEKIAELEQRLAAKPARSRAKTAKSRNTGKGRS